MERATSHSNINGGRIYQHFTIDPVLKNVYAFNTGIVFLYIGKNSKKIDLLLSAFGAGFAADSLYKTITILQAAPEKNNTPNIIIVDCSIDHKALKELHQFLQSDIRWSSIPCVLDASEAPEAEWKKFRNNQAIDEIIFLKDCDNKTLIKKFQFIKKVKNHPGHYLPIHKIELYKHAAFQPEYLLKRVFDIIVSSCAVVLLLPVFIVIALAVKIESRGPVFYISKRAGKGYRIFNFYKFRTMVLDADKNVEALLHLNQYKEHADSVPIFFKVMNDPRITRVGAFLRKFSLDELPQFFNVLKGDMSLVGNRPLPLSEAAALTTDQWATRFMAPAGITGLWQINKADQHEMSVEKRLNYDIMYVHKSGFIFDLWILAQTPAALIQKSKV